MEILEVWGEKEVGLFLWTTRKGKARITRVDEPWDVKQDPAFPYR